MFSRNNKISKRQMFRLLTYDMLGIGTLVLPPVVAEQSGKNGILGIVTGMGAGILFAAFMGLVITHMKAGESYPDYLKYCFGKFFGTLCISFYGISYLCLGGYGAYIFGHLMITDLLKNQSFYWITAGILLLVLYGISQGMEGRARIYELLFWFLMAPLIVMLIFAARDVELPRLFPLVEKNISTLLPSACYSFEVFVIGGFSLFLVPFAKKKESIKGACIAAVLFSGVLFAALFAILEGIFGIKSMAAMEYPAVTLMSMIQIPGGFFQRQDALMVAIWFFTVFALLNSSMFYAAENLKELTKGKKEKLWRMVSALIIFAIAILCYRFGKVTDMLHILFGLVITPLMVLIPLGSVIVKKIHVNGKRLLSVGIFLCAAGILSGCSTTELENRNFPLAMGVDMTEDGCRISYKFQNLSAVANQNTDSPSGTDFYIEDKDFFTGISKYANDTNRMLDYNHLKVLILSEDFIEDLAALENFLQVCGKEDLIARNTLLFVAEDAAKILTLDKNLDTPVGTYLEELMESREDYKLKDVVTLGDLYNDLANKEQLLLVPVLTDKGGMPAIGNYYAISGGICKGEISIKEAILSYLVQGKIRKLAFSLEDGTGIWMNRIRVREDFDKEELCYYSKIKLEMIAEKKLKSGSKEGEILRKKVKRLMSEQIKQTAEKLSDNPKIDMTNSYYKLGMYDKEKYQKYKGYFTEYQKDIKYEFEVDVILLNERG